MEIIKKEYNVYLYPVQKYYGETMPTLCKTFPALIDDAKAFADAKQFIEQEKMGNYWLYELQIIQVDYYKKQNQYSTAKCIVERCALKDMIEDKSK